MRRNSEQMSNARVMWRMLGLVRPLMGFMAISVVAGVLGFVCAIGLPTLGAEGVLVATGRGSLAWGIAGIGWSLALLAVARGVLHYVEQRCNHYIAFRLLAHIRDLVFSSLRKLAPAKLAGADRGSLISTLTSDVELLEVFYAHTISPILIATIMAVIMAVALGGVHIELALLALCAYAAVGVAVPLCVSRASGDAGKKVRDQAGDLSGFVLQSLRGLGDIMQFGAGERRMAQLDACSRDLVDSQRSLRKVGARGQAFVSAIILVATVAQLALAVSLFNAGAIGAEQALLAVVGFASSFGPFIALANLGSTLQSTLASARRVLQILDEKPLVLERADGAEPDFTGATANSVTFSYPGEPADALPVLKDVFVSLKPGAIVGISGRSGSGKSTLCRLFMRFWDVQQGSVRISNEDVRDIRTSSLRNLEALVEQDTYLFHDSIRDNLLIAKPDATQEELEEACRAASVHDFIMSLPKGYDTMVGELGDTLSGGERQRLGLARAFLHDAPFLLLDEPTSNLDALNEGAILAALDAQRGSRCVLLVSHRKSTMAIADKTYSMDSGRVS